MGGAGKKDKTYLGRVLPCCGFSQPWGHPLSGVCPCLGSVCRESKAPAGSTFRHTFPLLLGPRGACKASGHLGTSLFPAEHPCARTGSLPAGEIQLNNSCHSSHGLWLGALPGQDVLGHRVDKGTGNKPGSVGSACSPQEPAWFAKIPSLFPGNAQARLQSCLTSDEFGPGLKMSVDVLLPHDKRAGV